MLTKNEIYERLRKLKQPITLFGESLKDKQKRLYRLEAGESEESVMGTKTLQEYREEVHNYKTNNKNPIADIADEKEEMEMDDNFSNYNENDNVDNVDFDDEDETTVKKWKNRISPNQYNFIFIFSL